MDVDSIFDGSRFHWERENDTFPVRVGVNNPTPVCHINTQVYKILMMIGSVASCSGLNRPQSTTL